VHREGRVVTPLLPECPLCGNSTWWRGLRPLGPWICGVCVPPELPPDEVEWREEAPLP